MKLIVDANVLYSAFLRRGLTRQVLFNREVQLYAPSFLLEEFFKYFPELCHRSKERPEDLKALTARIIRRIRLVQPEECAPYATAAQFLTTDEKDRVYIACALAIGADLWSRDRHLIQPRIKCWKTESLAEKLGLFKK